MSQSQENKPFDRIPDDVWLDAYFGHNPNIPSAQELAELFAEDPYPSADEWADMFMPIEDFNPTRRKISNKECIIRGIDVLASFDLAPLFEDKYYMHHNPYYIEYTMVLFRNANDGKKYFLKYEDNFSVLHPYDSTIAYQYFDEEYRKTVLTSEFFYQGKNVFEGMNLQPWYVNKETGEIVSYFKFTGEKLFYKPGYQRLYLSKDEDFKIPHQDPFKVKVTYGHKVKDKGIWTLEHNPKKAFFLDNIHGDNGTFLDVVSYDKIYNKEYVKYKKITKSIVNVLKNTISETCKVAPNDIRLPYKMIICIFKCYADEIKKYLDTKPAPVYTKTKPPRLKAKQPEAPAPSEDVFPLIGTLAKMLNNGKKPLFDFYECDTCESESVCMHKEIMLNLKEEIKKQEEKERLERYIKINAGQGHLFPELLKEVRGQVK